MPEETTLTPEPKIEAQVKFTIGQAEIVDGYISRELEPFLKQQSGLQEAIMALEEDIGKNTEEVSRQVNIIRDKQAENFKESLNSLNFFLREGEQWLITSTAQFYDYDNERGIIVTLNAYRTAKGVKASDLKKAESKFTDHIRVLLPEDLATFLAQSRETSNKKKELEKELKPLTYKIQKIRESRKARMAALNAAVLEQSEQGKNIMEFLRGVNPDVVLDLTNS